MNRKNWLILAAGCVIGIIAASVYWRSSQERSKFLFSQNVKCQEIGKEYQATNGGGTRPIVVIEVKYSPSRNSCVAELGKTHQGGSDFTVDDLLSGEQLFDAPYHVGEDMQKSIKEQDAKFSKCAR